MVDFHFLINFSSQVVGWPPVRAYRMNSLSNVVKSPANKEFTSKSMKNNAKSIARQMDSDCCNDFNPKQGLLLKSSYVKVNMDGVAIGRKVNLTAHDCYEKLAHTLEKMFSAPIASADVTRESLFCFSCTSKVLIPGFHHLQLFIEILYSWNNIFHLPWSILFANRVPCSWLLIE